MALQREGWNRPVLRVTDITHGITTGCGCACLWLIAKCLAVAGNKEKSDSSTTHAAVSDGTIIINDSAKQQQNVDDLSRDVTHEPAGYYTEYVHPTPGISGPGPQRIVVGKQGETYYTNDHYKTFIKIK